MELPVDQSTPCIYLHFSVIDLCKLAFLVQLAVVVARTVDEIDASSVVIEMLRRTSAARLQAAVTRAGHCCGVAVSETSAAFLPNHVALTDLAI